MYSGLDNPRQWLVTAALKEHARHQPNTLWVSESESGTLSFGQADAYSAKAAGFFQSHGVARGDRVGVFLYNSCDFVVAWMGLGYLGAPAVLLNTELRGAFLRHQLNDSAVALVVVDAAQLHVLADIADELLHVQTVVVVGVLPTDVHVPPRWQLISWPDWGQAPQWEKPLPDPQPEDIACIMYTSGTSGPSKGVLMPHAHCTLYGIGSIKSLQLTEEDRYYICLPLFHANGLLMQLVATLLVGIPAFIRRRFSASAWLQDVRQSQATVSNLLGATAGFLVNQPSNAYDQQHHLRALMCAPNLAAHEQAFHERFGVRDVVSGFGMTEVNIPIWGRLGCSEPGAAGWVHDEHFDVCITDPNTDMPLPFGEMGEILVRPKIAFGFMAGYVNAPDKTVEAWRNLWFHTGDAGVMRSDGLITFVDRIKDCIRRRGENISATEVEEIVAQLDGVQEVAAYAVPSDIPAGEDEVMLAVVPQEGAVVNPAQLVSQASEQLPKFAKPRYVRLMQELPKTSTGKVQRAVLRKQGSDGAFDADSVNRP